MCRKEINAFEEALTDHSILVIKFWLHISTDVQRARFQEREQTPEKQYKIGPDDWRNLEKRAAYELAVTDMLTNTNTANAPWELVAANDKPFARIAILATICNRLRAAINE